MAVVDRTEISRACTVAAVALAIAFSMVGLCRTDAPPAPALASPTSAEGSPAAVCVDMRPADLGPQPAPLLEARPLGALPALRMGLGYGARALLGDPAQWCAQGWPQQGKAAHNSRIEPCLGEDRGAVELALIGRCDFSVSCAAPSPTDLEGGLFAEPLAVEVWALATAGGGAVRDLTCQQARDVLRGALVHWSELGGETLPLQLALPADQAERERALRGLLPSAPPSRTARPFAAIEDALSLLRREPGMLALVPLCEELERADVTILSIDGVAPGAAAFVRGEYQGGVAVYLTARREAQERVLQACSRLLDPAAGLLPRRLMRP